jgi:hypothetical protein
MGNLNSEPTTNNPVIVPLGGFLGAGKTSLILAAARILQQQGIKTAAILNDQGAELTDSRWVQSQGVQADQVTGGCFCCLFSDLVSTAERLRAHSAEVIFAEAVGSCTDISATTLQPLKLYHRDKFRLAPYTVVVDPDRAKQLAAGDSDPDFTFLFEKQIAEADLVCFTKSDLHSALDTPKIDSVPFRYLSSVTGDGVNAWLDEILVGALPSGTKILDVDYDHYARAEARLAWLNCRASLTLQPEDTLSPPTLIGPLLDDLEASLTTANFQIAHLKITDDSPAGILKASIVRNGVPAIVEGDLSASPATTHELLLNIRASGEPDLLREIVETHLFRLPGDLDVEAMQSFRPSAPSPEYRLTHVAQHVTG